MNKLDYQSPIGILEIIGDETAISSILFTEKEVPEHPMDQNTPAVMKDCYQQLDEYFNGQRKEFNLPYKLNGTVFQTSVWNALNSIPYAKTGSYRDIATVIGNEKAIRAVGNANSKNKLTIIIPCHRIIGSNASLTGYAGGLWRKKWLLEHEQKY